MNSLIPLLLLLSILCSCSAPSSPSPIPSASVPVPTATSLPDIVSGDMPYEIIAEGDPMSGGVEGGGFQFAFRGGDPYAAIPGGLPRDARQALDLILQHPSAGIYAVIYGGRAGSSGYSIQIRSVVGDETGVTITFAVQSPGPKQPVPDVLTYPYLILFIPGLDTSTEAVVFLQVQ